MCPAGSKSWVGDRGTPRFPPWRAPARRALARAHRRREGAAPACPLAPRALRGPPARGAPPSASVTAPRTCGCQLAAPRPRPAARWAAGTPPPPARAEVSAAGGQGRGKATRGRRRGPQGGPSQRERRREGRVQGPGAGGRAASSPCPHFADWSSSPAFETTESRAFPASGGGHAWTRSACRAVLRRERGSTGGRAPLAGHPPGGELCPAVAPSAPSAPTPGPPGLAPSSSEPRRCTWKVQHNNSGLFWWWCWGDASGIDNCK